MPQTPQEYILAVLGILFFALGVWLTVLGGFVGAVLLVVGAIFLAGWLVLAGGRSARKR